MDDEPIFGNDNLIAKFKVCLDINFQQLIKQENQEYDQD
jgi:hypothetical protein